jgi:hypothetical protein
MTSSRILTTLLAAGLALGSGGAVLAQKSADNAPMTQIDRVAQVSPERATLLRLNRKISLKVEDTRLEDVIKFIQDVTQADIEPLWTTDNSSGTGLDKEKKITLNVQNQPALYVLEAVLEKARADFAENTWQMSGTGAIQIGPKELLNKTKRVVIYDIHDLLMIIPRYTEVPAIDLNSVLQSNQGGSGQSPFKDAGDNKGPLDNLPTMEERAKKIQDLITQLVEPSQWQDNGGEGASMHYFNGTLIVNAPDYIHRALNGYSYWPSGTRQVAAKDGQRRWVTLNMDPGISTIKEIRQVPVTAVAGGAGGGSVGGGGAGGGGGSGGSTVPAVPARQP